MGLSHVRVDALRLECDSRLPCTPVEKPLYSVASRNVYREEGRLGAAFRLAASSLDGAIAGVSIRPVAARYARFLSSRGLTRSLYPRSREEHTYGDELMIGTNKQLTASDGHQFDA